jgi:hypothetical protein
MLTKTLAAALFAFALTGVAAAETDASQVPVADYTVFVDLPTGFAFLKLPQGWKFAGKVDDAELAKLPDSVLTALLKSDEEPMLARREDGAPMN